MPFLNIFKKKSKKSASVKVKKAEEEKKIKTKKEAQEVNSANAQVETKGKAVEKSEKIKEGEIEKREEAQKSKKIKESKITTREKSPIPVFSERRTKSAYKILVRPIITEKATMGESIGRYTFEVSLGSNKIEIKKAIKELYNLEPLRINIIRVKGKAVRYGHSRGRTKDWKKAIVFLKEGQKIEFVKK